MVLLKERTKQRAATLPTRSRRQTVKVRKERPNFKFLDQKQVKDRSKKRALLFCLFVSAVAMLFFVAYSQAELVSNQRQLDEIRSQTTEIETEIEIAKTEINLLSSPNHIVSSAQDMGMVQAAQALYIKANEE